MATTGPRIGERRDGKVWTGWAGWIPAREPVEYVRRDELELADEMIAELVECVRLLTHALDVALGLTGLSDLAVTLGTGYTPRERANLVLAAGAGATLNSADRDLLADLIRRSELSHSIFPPEDSQPAHHSLMGRA